MLSNALNQRYATVEDLFVKFVAPEICGRIAPDNDTYFLYSPYKNICPSKALIEKGITMHYTPYHIHKQFVEDFNSIGDKICKGIKDYFASENQTIELKDTFKNLFNSDNTFNLIQILSLRLGILDIFNYINLNVISELPSYENYSYIISLPNFVIDESRYGSASDITLNIGFQKLSDLSVRISLHIPNINTFTVLNMIDVYKECVLKENFDIIYTTYKFLGYMVLNNSQTYNDYSLCRLCDISKIGMFKIITEGNNIYDYDACASFSANSNQQIFPKNPYTFQLVSHYISNNYALPFQITNILVTNMTANGLTYTNTTTQEAINYYKSLSGFAYTDLMTSLYVDVNSVGDGASLEDTGGSPKVPADKLDDISPELKLESGTLQMKRVTAIRPSGVLNNGTWSSQILGSSLQMVTFDTLYNSNNTVSTKTPYAWGGYNYATNRYNQTLLPNNLMSHITTIIDKEWDADELIAQKYKNTNAQDKTYEAAGLNAAGTGGSYRSHITSIDDLKYANSNLILKNMQVGIVPYVDYNFIPSYLNAKTSINPNSYTNYAVCFVEPNKNVNKRSAIITLTLNESQISEDITISLYGAPLIINLSMANPIPKANYIYTYQYINDNNKKETQNISCNLLWRFALKPKNNIDLYEEKYNPSDNNNKKSIIYKYNNISEKTLEKICEYGGFIDISTNLYGKDVYYKPDNNNGAYRYYRSSYTNEPSAYFLFLTSNKSLNKSNANLEDLFIIRCDYAEWNQLLFRIYYDSYSLTVPDVLKRIILNCEIEPIFLAANQIKENNKIEEVKNYSDIIKKYQNQIGNSSISLYGAQMPVIDVEYLYDGQSLDSHTYTNLNTLYTVDTSVDTSVSDAYNWANGDSNNFFNSTTKSFASTINLNIITTPSYNINDSSGSWYQQKSLNPFQRKDESINDDFTLNLFQ